MKRQFLLWSILSTLVSTSVAQSVPPQIITLEDGTRFTYLGVTVGTHQMAPGYETLGTANWFYGKSNTTVVWIQTIHDPKKWPNYRLLVSDVANTGCVSLEKGTSSHVKEGVDVQGFPLTAFPRWDQEIILRVKPYQGAVSKEHFVMTNSAPVSVANWTPKPLPETEADGDLEVTLTKLIAGVPMPRRDGEKPPVADGPENQCVRLDFDFRQNGQATTNWQFWPVVTSDAFGNHALGFIQDYPSNGISPIYPDRIHPTFPPTYDGYFYNPGLWPNKSPWKVQLEFTRKSGFSDDEIVTFTNLPVKPGSREDHDAEWTWDASKTNFSFIAQARVNGVQLKMLPPLLIPNASQPGRKSISVILYADPEPSRAMKLSVIQAFDGQGRRISSPFSPGWAGHYSIDLPDPSDDVTMLNLKLALHKSRFVEFTVKPTRE